MIHLRCMPHVGAYNTGLCHLHYIKIIFGFSVLLLFWIDFQCQVPGQTGVSGQHAL